MRRGCLMAWRVLCLTGVLTAPLRSHAEVIFDNGLTPDAINANGIASFSFTSTTEGHQYQVGDDFMLPGDGQWSVDGARWTGVLASRFDLMLTIGETFDFDILILNDDNGRPTGTPQDIFPGTAIATRQVQATGTENGVFNYAGEFEVSFDPIILQGETPYWIVIAPHGDFLFTESNPGGLGWAWLGEVDTGNAWLGGADFRDDWLQQHRHQDFGLLGEAFAATMPGDYNVDGALDVLDIDIQAAEMAKVQADQDLATFDHNGDNLVDFKDRSVWVKDLRETWLGDANFDDEFNSLDFVAVLASGKYEQDIPSSWSEGDWDGDFRFSTSDLVAALDDGGYEQGPRSAVAASVPEPATGLMSSLALIMLFARRHNVESYSAKRCDDCVSRR